MSDRGEEASSPENGDLKGSEDRKSKRGPPPDGDRGADEQEPETEDDGNEANDDGEGE